MAKQEIDIGVEGNDGTGDSIRESFRKVNENFQEVYAIFGLGGQISFTSLDDTPGTDATAYVGNEGNVLLVNQTATGINFYKLVSDAGTNDAEDPDNTISFSVDGDKLILRSINTKLLNDPSPELENPLKIGNTAAYDTTVQSLMLSNPGRTTLVSNWNTTHGTPTITEANLLTSIGFTEQTYVSLTGDTMTGALSVPAGAATTQVPQVQEVIRKVGDNMDAGSILNLGDHPYPFAGYGSPTSQYDLQAATKFYVDSTTYSSSTNIYVSTKGDDTQRFAPPGRGGRSLAYAYKTIGKALEKATILQESSPIDIGPYVQTITYQESGDTLDSYAVSTSGRYSTTGDQTIAVATIEAEKATVIDAAIEFLNTTYPNFVYDERLCRRDLGLILDSIKLDLAASGGSPALYHNLLSRYAGLRYNSNPSGELAISVNGQYTQTALTINRAKTLMLAEIATALGTGNTWYGATEDLFDTVLATINPVSSTPAIIESSKYYELNIFSGPNKYVDQAGDPTVPNPNQDIIPGKVIRGKTSGAVGRIVTYTRGRDAGGTPDHDIIEMHLLEPIEFLDDEILEYGNYVQRDQITIQVESGIYDEQFPMRLPTNTSINGDEFRRTIIRPSKGSSASPAANTWFYRDAEIDGLITARAGEGAFNDDSTLRGYYGYHYTQDPNNPLNISDYALNNQGSYIDASRLIELNKEFIKAEILAWLDATYPLLTYDATLWSRITGNVVTGIADDLRVGDRRSSVKNQGYYYGQLQDRVETAASILQIYTIIDNVLDNDSDNPYTALSAVSQTFNTTLEAEAGSKTVANDLVNLVAYAFAPGFNPALDNNQMDVFLCDDATIVRNVTCQRHGGFMMVLDPEGSILTRSPYAQTNSSFSGSKNAKTFAGGMFIDGYTYNMPLTVIRDGNLGDFDPFNIRVRAPVGSGLSIRKPKTPSAFLEFGRRYQVNSIKDYLPDAGDGYSYATLVLDEASNGGRGFDDAVDSAGPYDDGPVEIVLQGSGNRSMLANDFTQINDLGYGVIATNNALSELVSVFTYYCDTGYYALNGSQIRSLTGNNSYGNFGLVAEGSDPDELARVASLAMDLVQPAKMYVVDFEIIVSGDVTSIVTVGEAISQDGVAPALGYVAFSNYDSGTGNTTIYVERVTGAFESGTNIFESSSTDLGNPVSITNRGLTADQNDVTVYIYDLTNYPMNGSELEILHSTGIYQPYDVVNVGTTDFEIPLSKEAELCDSANADIRRKVWQLNLTSGVATADSGIQVQTSFGTLGVYRSKQNFLLNGINDGIFTRPSTALIFDEYPNYTYRTLAFEGTVVGDVAVIGQQSKVVVDDNYAYIDLNVVNNYATLSVGAGYTVNSTVGASIAGGTTLGSTQGDTNIAIEVLDDTSITRIVGKIFTWAGKVHRITGYSDVTITLDSTNRAIITFEDVYSIHPTYLGTGLALRADSITGQNFTLKAGIEEGASANITVNISTCRATSHDFLDIGTGGYNTSNYPDRTFGAPINAPVDDGSAIDQFGFNTKAQVQERTRGRAFFASTDQDGFFRVGRFFTVDQGTGSVTFNAALVLTNIDGIGFKRGVRVNEFSPDTAFTNASGSAVATEAATEGYVNRRLGWDRDGDALDAGDIIGGGAVRAAGGIMTGDLNMTGNFVTNLSTPVNGTDAANKNYVDAQVSLYDELSELTDVNIAAPQTADILVYNSDTAKWVNEGISSSAAISDATITYAAGVAKIEINSGAILNADVNNSASIAQSKLALSDATAAATSGAATKGIASFSNASFDATTGFITVKALGITNAQLAGSIANGKLANSSISVTDGTESSSISLGDTLTFAGTTDEVTVGQSGGTVTISLPATINADTTGNAATATTATTATTASNVVFAARNTNAATHYIAFTSSTNGSSLGLYTDSTLSYVPSTDTLTVSNITMTGSILPGLNNPTDSGQNIGSATNKWNTVYATVFNGTSTKALYADLAENYLGDTTYEPGTVLVFGGDAEVTVSSTKGDRKVAGVVSTNPAHLMNSALEGNHVVALALQGRVPCKVLGRVAKGDILVTAAKDGYAIVDNDAKVGTVIGKAVGTKTDDGYGIVEIVVGRV
tara:strand:+ start:1523 stop:7789 length:6267 start_codon:yes stop_codon:yes gene_type:complete